MVARSSYASGLEINTRATGTYWNVFHSSAYSRKASCQLLAKECALNTGKLPPAGGFRLARQEQCGQITDRPDMTLALYRESNKTYGKTNACYIHAAQYIF